MGIWLIYDGWLVIIDLPGFLGIQGILVNQHSGMGGLFHSSNRAWKTASVPSTAKDQCNLTSPVSNFHWLRCQPEQTTTLEGKNSQGRRSHHWLHETCWFFRGWLQTACVHDPGSSISGLEWPDLRHWAAIVQCSLEHPRSFWKEKMQESYNSKWLNKL